jgi:D-alanyl-D-alanine carboxypeptidase/D-alanyl-D-alanine-endopeptidase (penicillin-binding protein 4)
MPRWVDGSGLSRFNQFTPEDMIKVLNKIKAEQPWERITGIFAPAGTGTLRMYKSKNSPFIYAKSGSLTGVVCLSGYVYSKDKKWLTFSIMINNHNASGAVLRKRMEGFLEKL